MVDLLPAFGRPHCLLSKRLTQSVVRQRDRRRATDKQPTVASVSDSTWDMPSTTRRQRSVVLPERRPQALLSWVAWAQSTRILSRDLLQMLTHL
jgi:hypothetical protein